MDYRPRSWQLSPAKAIALPLALVAALVALGLLHTQEAVLTRAYLGAAAALLVGAVALYVQLRRSGRISP